MTENYIPATIAEFPSFELGDRILYGNYKVVTIVAIDKMTETVTAQAKTGQLFPISFDHLSKLGRKLSNFKFSKLI